MTGRCHICGQHHEIAVKLKVRVERKRRRFREELTACNATRAICTACIALIASAGKASAA